jgi:Tol biopolymer transport system component
MRDLTASPAGSPPPCPHHPGRTPRPATGSLRTALLPAARLLAVLLPALAGLLACQRDGKLTAPASETPPAEQTLATVVRLFGEGRPIDHPTYWPRSPGSAPGDSIAFTAKLTGRYHIYMSDPRGAGRHAITSAAGSNSNPSWDPTGSWVAYASIRTGQWDIWRTAPDGSLDLPVTDDRFEDQDPAVSPDGLSIVFASKRDTLAPRPSFDLWLVDLADGEMEQLTRVAADDRHPCWSPDGSEIVFSRVRGDSTASLEIFGVDTGTTYRLTDSGGAYDVGPAWSPDGRFVAFASTRGVSWDLWIVAIDDRGQHGSAAIPRPLTDTGWNDRRPAWSPHPRVEEAHLLFTSDRGGEPAIWQASHLLP